MNIVFLCIGTPRIIGDSVGPMLGDLLLKKGVQAFVYGTTYRPITAINIDRYYEIIRKHHDSDIVIAIDSALGVKDDIGKIKINPSGIRPGGAFDKTKDRVGDIGILAIVGNKERDKYDELEKVSQTQINELTQKIASVLLEIV